ncbi:MAG TPA: ferritin-like domain-containing protein [Noviherbaspirillum sp.]
MITSPQRDSVEPKELRGYALRWLCEPDPARKIAGTSALYEARERGEISLDMEAVLVSVKPIPGRPERPLLVSPLAVKPRAMHTLEGRAAMIHALAHIEFNAINLALDAIWRFPGMPAAFYEDWLRVAAEEARHFSLLSSHLNSLGFAYGDFPAHNSLWDMAEKTSSDVLARIALVPRTFEARGLDASPPVRAKLAQAGDHAAAEILDIILRDEIGHVAVGNRWFAWLCETRGLEPLSTYASLTEQYKAPPLRGPFNIAARKAAGFNDAELAALK